MPHHSVQFRGRVKPNKKNKKNKKKKRFLPQVECRISGWWWRNRIISTTLVVAAATGAAVTSGKTMGHKDEENTEFLIRNSSEPEKKGKELEENGKKYINFFSKNEAH